MKLSPEGNERPKVQLEQLADFDLIQKVINGLKPGCIAQLVNKDGNDPLIPNDYAEEITRKYGLECIRSPNADGNEIEEICKFTPYAIANKRKVEHLLAKAKLPDIPEIQNRLPRLIGEIRNMTIAEALVYLGKYPRVDEEFSSVGGESNLERPEVAVLEGVLLGYKPCCIHFYVNRNFLRKRINPEQEMKEVEKIIEIIKYFGETEHLLCESCCNSRYEEMVEELDSTRSGIVRLIRKLFKKLP